MAFLIKARRSLYSYRLQRRRKKRYTPAAGTLSEFGTAIPVGGLVDEKTHRRRIHDRYRRIGDGVLFSDGGGTVTNRSPHGLSEGCRACKGGTWYCLFVGLRCNAACRFCTRDHTGEGEPEPADFRFPASPEVLVERIAELGGRIEGVSYSGGEPFLYLDSRVLPVAGLLTERRPDIYQWIYTNGMLVTAEALGRLKAAGIREVRVDLAATNFSAKVLGKLPMIREIVGKVTVEVPAITEVSEKLLGEGVIERLAGLGVEQLNLAELYVVRKDAASFIRGEEVYYSRRGSLSPTGSRHRTVDIMERVVGGGLPLLVNDCSNDAKYVQYRNQRHPLYKSLPQWVRRKPADPG
jgi:pyruvate formate-lyase activating enzyme-like uncharacterized protein